MSGKPASYYVVKTVRYSGWFLLLFLILFIVSGYSMCGEFGFERVLDPHSAETLHKAIDVPLVAVFLVHSLAAIYLAFRRWGWIKGRRKT